MKRTGRYLNLVNDINSADPGISTISAAPIPLRMTTIFNDDREGYGWRITEFTTMGTVMTGMDALPTSMVLTTARPDAFANATEFSDWVTQRAMCDNSLIGVYNLDDRSTYYIDRSTIKTDHVAVNHLAIIYPDGMIPYYKITLEEYKISDKEEIIYKLKEVGQNVGQRT